MPSMLEMLEDQREVGTDVGVNSSTGEDMNFVGNLKRWTQKVINDYLKHGININKNIASIAQQNNLNNEQIQRIVEEVNTQVYLVEYGKTKNRTTRDVEFEIGNMQDIKNLLGNDVRANLEAPHDPENPEEPTMKKKASLEDEGDKLNFLNYSPYDTFGLAEDKSISMEKIAKRELEGKVAQTTKEFNKVAMDFGTDIYCMADALIKFARLNEDHQSIFEKVAKESELKKSTQSLIKKAMAQKIEQLKKAKVVSPNFNCDLELVDGFTKEAKLTLGKYSLIKEAGDNSSNKPLPTVITDKKLIKGYKDLINLASDIKKAQDEVIQKQNEKLFAEKQLQDLQK